WAGRLRSFAIGDIGEGSLFGRDEGRPGRGPAIVSAGHRGGEREPGGGGAGAVSAGSLLLQKEKFCRGDGSVRKTVEGLSRPKGPHCARQRVPRRFISA